MDRRTKILVFGCFLAVFMLNYAYLFFSKDQTEYKLFPYNSVLISKQAHADYAARWISYIVIAVFHMAIVPRFKEMYFFIASAFSILLIDYFLNYNDPFLIHPLFAGLWLPVSASLWIGVTLVSIVCILIFKK